MADRKRGKERENIRRKIQEESALIIEQKKGRCSESKQKQRRVTKQLSRVQISMQQA